MKAGIFSLVLLLLSLNSFATQKLVHINKSVEIDQDIKVVFDLVSNTMNDHHWRSEVNDMSADGEFAVGTIFTEDAHIGLRKNFITRTQLIELHDLKNAFYVTPKDAPYFLSSRREVKELSNGKTLVTYTVKFDPKMSRVTVAIPLPRKVLEVSYGLIIKKYLKNLKKYLE
jgi:hypothetical protein